MSDQHADDLMALVRELSELEFRRGVLHARIEWHMRLRDVAAEVEVDRPAPPRPRPAKPVTARTPRGRLRETILAHVAAHPDQSARQIAAALKGNYESIRQALIRMAEAGQLTRTMGGSYAVAESHAGSGLVHA